MFEKTEYKKALVHHINKDGREFYTPLDQNLGKYEYKYRLVGRGERDISGAECP